MLASWLGTATAAGAGAVVAGVVGVATVDDDDAMVVGATLAGEAAVVGGGEAAAAEAVVVGSLAVVRGVAVDDVVVVPRLDARGNDSLPQAVSTRNRATTVAATRAEPITCPHR